MSRPASGGNPVLNLGVLALVVAALCLLPMMTTPYYIRVATGVALWAGLALSWNVICGYAGYISFGHVAFFGIGAYTTAILMQPEYAWNFWATLPVAAVVAGAVAALVGWPALRLKGAYFAIATWALAEAVRELTTVLDFTGGSGGLTTPIRLGDNFFYYTMLAASAIAFAVCYLLLERSRFGFRVKAARDNEVLFACALPRLGIVEPLHETERRLQPQLAQELATRVERQQREISIIEPQDVEHVIARLLPLAPSAGRLAVEDHVAHLELPDCFDERGVRRVLRQPVSRKKPHV